MKTKFSGKEYFFCCVFVSLLSPFGYAQGMRGNDLASIIKQHEELATRFKAGDTNVPLLSMAWFFSGVWFCSIDHTGRVAAWLDTGHSMRGGGRGSLDATNLELLTQTISNLPQPPKNPLSDERKVIVSGVRSNQWFQNIYDRSDIPKEVEKLYEISGAHVNWFIPEVKGSQTARIAAGSFARIARDAPIAVIVGNSLLQVLDMTDSSHHLTPKLKTTPYLFSPIPWESVVISPDGKIIVLATHYAVHAVDWQGDRELWKTGHLEQDGGRSNNGLAIGGDKDQFLFAAGAHTVERWDLSKGQKLSTLATNQPVIKFLGTSHNGRVLVAGFDDSSNLGPLATSFTVWEADKDEPARQFSEAKLTGLGISPDGKHIALSVAGQSKLVIYDWQNNERREVPMRIPYGSRFFLAMYWSPDGKHLAAFVDTNPASIIIYETSTWKPLAHWTCGRLFNRSRFAFNKSGTLLQLLDSEINGLQIQN